MDRKFRPTWGRGCWRGAADEIKKFPRPQNEYGWRGVRLDPPPPAKVMLSHVGVDACGSNGGHDGFARFAARDEGPHGACVR